MRIYEQRLTTIVTDVLCDVCNQSTSTPEEAPQFGILSAKWGYGSRQDGEQYEVHLCEECFSRTLLGLKRERMVNQMFDDEQVAFGEKNQNFGLVSRDNFFKD